MIAAETALDQHPDEPIVLQRIRAYARRKVLWLRHLWSATPPEADPGLTISHGEIDRMLLSPAALDAAERDFYHADAQAKQLTAFVREADHAWLNDTPWVRLRRLFSLSNAECDLLSLAVAAELDPEFLRLYGYLMDQAVPAYPSAQLASRLFAWPACEAIGPRSNLLRWSLVDVQGSTTPTTYQADRTITAWLLGERPVDASLGSAVEYRERRSVHGLDLLYRRELNAMFDFAKAARSQLVELELIGPEGSGKRTLAAQLGVRLGLDLFIADAQALLGGDTPPAMARDRTMRVLRSAKLYGAMPYWHRADQIELSIDPVWAGPDKDITAVGRAMRHTRGTSVAAHRSFVLPDLTKQQRVALWSQRSEADPPRQVAEWLLTPNDVVAAARVAEAGRDAVAESFRTIFQGAMRELFTPLPCPFTWNDIVLTPAIRRHLYEFEAQARLRWEVYEEWGFGRLCPLGRGVAALFAGPSGSGKTMAAQVLAGSLGMDLYRVDLAGVMNKYIGETEKRLKKVFDACERANVVLLFDEADALFGQRTQVRDAHDRFANIEIDYLLQRMEQFDGIAILASNRKGDLDKAFVRRLRFIVDFTHPGSEERLVLWRMALVERSPAGERVLDTIDWQFLADRVVMSAAEIKLAALGAAFLARTEGSRIGMRHVLAACRRELAKQGIELRGGELEQ